MTLPAYTRDTQLLTIEQVAERVQFTQQTIREMCQRKELRATKLKGQWRIYPESVEEWLAAGEPEPGVILPMPRSRVAASGFKALVGGMNG